MDDVQPTPDPIAPYVAERVSRDDWGAVDALKWAKARDVVDTFRSCVMLVRLCADEAARRDPAHALLHRLAGVAPGSHVGPELVAVTQRALGISDAHAAQIVRDLDAEDQFRAGLAQGAATDPLGRVA